MRLRKLLFPLLVTFALVSSQISAAYALFVLLAAGWIAAGWRAESFRRALTHPLTALAGVYALLVALSVLFSVDPRASLRAIPSLSLLLLVPITIDLVDTPRRARAILFAAAASGTAMALFGLVQLARDGATLENRIHANLSHYMTLSGLTLIAGCVLLAFLFEGRGRTRWWGAAALIPLSAMVFTLTRGAYVGAVAAVTAYLTLRRPRGLLLVAPALVAVFFLFPPDVRRRAASIVDPTDTTNRDRIAMARAGARMIADRPIFGLGPEMVKPYYTLYRDPDAPRWRVPHLHDNVLQIAAASGVFAAGAYLALLALFFARAGRLLRVERDPGPGLSASAAFLAVAAVSVAGLFEYNFGDKEVLMATLPLLALPFSRAMAKREESGAASRETRVAAALEPIFEPGRRIQS
ncbi:MAG TPA: O-antigen ligase family protein [Thermoanaerobaculia bacterium]|nr:O-antigen ligase family protein [Thermoanaerobaculia bacterium]